MDQIIIGIIIVLIGAGIIGLWRKSTTDKAECFSICLASITVIFAVGLGFFILDSEMSSVFYTLDEFIPLEKKVQLKRRLTSYVIR